MEKRREAVSQFKRRIIELYQLGYFKYHLELWDNLTHRGKKYLPKPLLEGINLNKTIIVRRPIWISGRKISYQESGAYGVYITKKVADMIANALGYSSLKYMIEYEMIMPKTFNTFQLVKSKDGRCISCGEKVRLYRIEMSGIKYPAGREYKDFFCKTRSTRVYARLIPLSTP